MRWSYPYGTPETSKEILGAQGDPYKVFDSLAAFGYSGVELFVRDPAQFDHSALSDALAMSGLEVAAIGTGPIVTEDHLTLTLEDDHARLSAIERARSTVDLGAELGAQVNLGKLRGALGDDTERSWTWMRKGLLAIADHALAANVLLTLEPQNSGVIDNINTTQAGVDFIVSLGHPNIRLMVDTYHAQLEDRWPSLAYVRAGTLLEHVHFADSDRLQPGQGVVDFRLHLATLDALKYDRYITFEIAQDQSPLPTAKAAIDYITALSF